MQVKTSLNGRIQKIQIVQNSGESNSMENSKKDFLDSLDLLDQEMEKYIPYVLQDLLELGSIPDYVFQLINKNVEPKEIKTLIDFGCGKGAVLIYLANRYDFKGFGIDIVPEFINSANQHALKNSVSNRLDFIVGDLLEYLNKKEKYSIVIYGYDSSLLGSVYETVLQLRNSIIDSGYLILEIAFTQDSKNKIEGLPTEKELIEQLDKTDLKIIDKIVWDIEKIKTINDHNNIFINNRIKELKIKDPAKTSIFEKYMNNQIEECKLIENDMTCSTWILKK